MTSASSQPAPVPKPLVSQVIAALMDLRIDQSLFAPDCVSWHNFDETDVPTLPGSFDGLRAVRSVVPDYQMTEVAVHDVGNGVSFAQFVLRGTLPNGSAFRAPGVLVAHARGEKVVRLEEYLDTGQVSGVFAVLGVDAT